MIRTLFTASVALLMMGSVAAPGSAGPSGRTVRGSYSGAGGFVAGDTVGTIQTGTNWVAFDARRGERWVTISINDGASGTVLGYVHSGARESSFCQATDRPIRVVPGQTIYVAGMVGLCDGSPSVVTTGEVEVTFSR